MVLKWLQICATKFVNDSEVAPWDSVCTTPTPTGNARPATTTSCESVCSGSTGAATSTLNRALVVPVLLKAYVRTSQSTFVRACGICYTAQKTMVISPRVQHAALRHSFVHVAEFRSHARQSQPLLCLCPKRATVESQTQFTMTAYWCFTRETVGFHTVPRPVCCAPASPQSDKCAACGYTLQTSQGQHLLHITEYGVVNGWSPTLFTRQQPAPRDGWQSPDLFPQKFDHIGQQTRSFVNVSTIHAVRIQCRNMLASHCVFDALISAASGTT